MNSSSDEKAVASMSKCVSLSGEYSEHELQDEGDARFICQRCFAFEEDGALEAIEKAEAELARTSQAIEDIRALHNVVAYDEAGNHFCEHSRLDEPCETARILSGLSEHQEGAQP